MPPTTPMNIEHNLGISLTTAVLVVITVGVDLIHASTQSTQHHQAAAPSADEPCHHDWSEPNYQYKYAVASRRTGDVKGAWEKRAGSDVWGAYFLRDPDGHWRTVHYEADRGGFHAVVQRKPLLPARPARGKIQHEERLVAEHEGHVLGHDGEWEGALAAVEESAREDNHPSLKSASLRTATDDSAALAVAASQAVPNHTPATSRMGMTSRGPNAYDERPRDAERYRHRLGFAPISARRPPPPSSYYQTALHHVEAPNLDYHGDVSEHEDSGRYYAGEHEDAVEQNLDEEGRSAPYEDPDSQHEHLDGEQTGEQAQQGTRVQHTHEVRQQVHAEHVQHTPMVRGVPGLPASSMDLLLGPAWTEIAGQGALFEGTDWPGLQGAGAHRGRGSRGENLPQGSRQALTWMKKGRDMDTERERGPGRWAGSFATHQGHQDHQVRRPVGETTPGPRAERLRSRPSKTHSTPAGHYRQVQSASTISPTRQHHEEHSVEHDAELRGGRSRSRRPSKHHAHESWPSQGLATTHHHDPQDHDDLDDHVPSRGEEWAFGSKLRGKEGSSGPRNHNKGPVLFSNPNEEQLRTQATGASSPAPSGRVHGRDHGREHGRNHVRNSGNEYVRDYVKDFAIPSGPSALEAKAARLHAKHLAESTTTTALGVTRRPQSARNAAGPSAAGPPRNPQQHTPHQQGTAGWVPMTWSRPFEPRAAGTQPRPLLGSPDKASRANAIANAPWRQTWT